MATLKKTLKSRKPLRKPKPKTKGYWVKKLDQIFSLYIRQKYADHFGMVSCYTCGTRKHYKDMQNGHYISRGNMATRWDEENCRVQDSACNIFRGGNYVEYSSRLIEEVGIEKYKELVKKKYEIKQFSIKDLQEKIKYYGDRCKPTC
jgi:hypothetical protein